jgi:3-phenylpropionate/trans-cinnamate dioxygenase ferredoxin reductase component
MPASGTFVIAGGGLAGAKTAEALREQGFDGRIVLAAEENIRPYERPPLSKDYLQGKTSREEIFVHSRTGTTPTRSSCCFARRSPGSTGAAAK